MRVVRLIGLLCTGTALVAVCAGVAQAGETKTYTYDAMGRLVGEVTTGTVNSGTTVTYCHDAVSNRTLMVSNTSGTPAVCPISTPAPAPSPTSPPGQSVYVTLPIAGYYVLRVVAPIQ